MNIKLIIIDIDGVMCNGKIYSEQHECIAKQFNDLDFTAIKHFVALGIDVVFLSGDEFNAGMAKKRKVPFYHSRSDSGQINKSEMLDKIMLEYAVTVDEVMAVGDDYFDLPLLERVIAPFCPSNSPRRVRNACVTLEVSSGNGVISAMRDYLVLSGLIEECSLEQLTKIDANE